MPSLRSGLKWDPEKVVLVTHNADDKLPGVVSRGSSLNGSSYLSPSAGTNGRQPRTQVCKIRMRQTSAHVDP